MLLLRSVSQSCIHSLQDSLDILTRRRFVEALPERRTGLFSIRTPENEALAAPVLQSQASTATNAYNRQSSQPSNSNASVKSSLTAPSNRTSTYVDFSRWILRKSSAANLSLLVLAVHLLTMKQHRQVNSNEVRVFTNDVSIEHSLLVVHRRSGWQLPTLLPSAQ